LQRYVGIVDRTVTPQQLNVSLEKGESLVILVENQARINYGGQMNNNRKVELIFYCNLFLFFLLNLKIVWYSKTPLLRPPLCLRKHGLFSGVVLILS